MSLEIAWLALLGLLLAGYFVLGGFDLGVQILQPTLGGDEKGRRSLLGALGPFYLGNEVWLVAFAGVLFGAFPVLEGTMLSGLYPLIVTLLVGLVVGNAAVQLRSRYGSAGARKLWDGLVFFGGVVPALTWGLIVGVFLHGVQLGQDGNFHLTAGTLLDPFVLLCGLTTLVLFTAHGAAFLALRSNGDTAERARNLGRPLVFAALLLGTASTAAGATSAAVRNSVANPLTTLALAFGLLVILFTADRLLGGDHTGRAFSATSIAMALPVALVGVGLYPRTLASTVSDQFGLTISEAAADPVTLRILGFFAIPLIPLILAYQFWNWWAFRGRIDTPTYF